MLPSISWAIKISKLLSHRAWNNNSSTRAAIKEWHWAPKMFQAFGATLMLVNETTVLQILIKPRRDLTRINSVASTRVWWLKIPSEARKVDKEDYSLYNFILFVVFCYIYANVEIYNLFHADVHRAVTNCTIESWDKDFIFYLDNIKIVTW